jgi:hypothetical protein
MLFEFLARPIQYPGFLTIAHDRSSLKKRHEGELTQKTTLIIDSGVSFDALQMIQNQSKKIRKKNPVRYLLPFGFAQRNSLAK